MRILTVSAFYENHGGGIEIVAGETARALARRGHQCRWAAASFDPPPQDASVEAVPLNASDPLERWTGLPMPLPSRAARRLLEQEVTAADAVVVHDALYVTSVLAARYAHQHGKPWIMFQHIGAIAYKNPVLRVTMAAANRLVARPLIASAPQTVFISDAVREYFVGTRWKHTPALLLNGVDHSVFRCPARGERTQLRGKLGMSDEHRNLLFVGRFVEKKGLAAVQAMAAMRPAWNFWLAGSGPIDPRSWKLPNVKVLGRKSRDELAELYRAADALVLPSVGEGFPLVVQEAMASGLPIFCGLDSANADPGARELLCGLTVDPSDVVATAKRFAEAIAKTAPGLSSKLAAHARATYDWDTNAGWLEERLVALSRAQRPSTSEATPPCENTPAPYPRPS